LSVRWRVNENFPAPSVAVLRASGHDVLSIGEAHSGIDDMAVLALARQEGRWLVTFDRDYGEL
jgi:predicted nucleic acid-binding protein